MKKDIHTFVPKYDTFQRYKGEIVKPLGKLQLHPIPTVVCMVAIDFLSKYAHLCALKHPFKSPVVAKVFMDNIFKLHGMPHTIVTGNDSTFISNFWQ